MTGLRDPVSWQRRQSDVPDKDGLISHSTAVRIKQLTDEELAASLATSPQSGEWKAFIADENVPGASIRLLPSLGYDVAAISEIAPGTDNLDVIAIAQHALPPPGIVYFRETRQTPQDAALDLLALVTDPHVTLLGQYTVVRRERHIGQRPLPDR